MTLQPGQSFIRRNRTKLAALAGWLVLLVSFYGLLRLNNLFLADGVVLVSNRLTETSVGSLFFILLYVVGPLLFFPTTLLSSLAGFLFGPWGIPFVVIGSNASAW